MGYITKVKELYSQVSCMISDSGDSWKDFLDCQGRVYQLNFFNACMVYAQRKEATALASFGEWKRPWHCHLPLEAAWRKRTVSV